MPDRELKRLRVLFKLTHKELADYAGVSDQAISYYETGRSMPGGATAVKIAKRFQRPVLDVFREFLVPEEELVIGEHDARYSNSDKAGKKEAKLYSDSANTRTDGTLYERNNIQDLRADFYPDRKMTQQELADLVGVSRRSMSKYETRVTMPRLVVCYRIATVFNETVEGLFIL